jgi:hypothetical protein
MSLNQSRAREILSSGRADSRSQTFVPGNESAGEGPTKRSGCKSKRRLFSLVQKFQRFQIGVVRSLLLQGKRRLFRRGAVRRRSARSGKGYRRSAKNLRRHTFVNRNEEWWECTSGACGQRIQFRMLDKALHRGSPTCFCGCSMKRTYVKPHFTKLEVDSSIGPDATNPARVTIQLVDLTSHTTNCLIPGRDA